MTTIQIILMVIVLAMAATIITGIIILVKLCKMNDAEEVQNAGEKRYKANHRNR